VKIYLSLIVFLLSFNALSVELREKIGQMLLVGFRGYELDKNHPLSQKLKKGHIGSVILFDYDVVKKSRKRNIESPKQVKKLNRQIQSYSKIPVLITVDQEGGLVQRLKPRHGFDKYSSPQYLGSKSNTDQTFKEGLEMSKTLKKVGINLNFSPVADVNTNTKNPVIGKLKRSYSTSPETVANHVRAFLNSHKNNNIATTLKHFPGHGSSTADSHKGFVDVSETWSDIELIPFTKMINEKKADVIMSAHIFNGGLDPYYPGTLSKNTIQDLLREELGYDGVIISDDMNMGAIADHYGLENAIELAITAGIDILLFGNNLVYKKDIAEKSLSIIENLVKSGKISMDRINESYNRVMTLKVKMGLIKDFEEQPIKNKIKRDVANTKHASKITERDSYKKNLKIFRKLKSN